MLALPTNNCRQQQQRKSNVHQRQSMRFLSFLSHMHLVPLYNSLSYQAGIAYLVTILLCVAYRNNAFSHLTARIRRRQQYQTIPDEHGINLPSYYSQDAYANNNRGAECWSRCVIQIRNFFQRILRQKSARNKRRRE